MNKIAIFGKPGGGKSTLCHALANATGITAHSLDSIEYNKDGTRVSRDVYMDRHAQLVAEDNWIIEGLGVLESFWQRLDAADTLIYIDLPYHVHYWWVTKRLIKGIFVKPIGWPEESSVWQGTLASWKFLRLSPKFWNLALYEQIELKTKDKKFYRIDSVYALNQFVKQLNVSKPHQRVSSNRS